MYRLMLRQIRQSAHLSVRPIFTITIGVRPIFRLSGCVYVCTKSVDLHPVGRGLQINK